MVEVLKVNLFSRAVVLIYTYYCTIHTTFNRYYVSYSFWCCSCVQRKAAFYSFCLYFIAVCFIFFLSSLLVLLYSVTLDVCVLSRIIFPCFSFVIYFVCAWFGFLTLIRVS